MHPKQLEKIHAQRAEAQADPARDRILAEREGMCRDAENLIAKHPRLWKHLKEKTEPMASPVQIAAPGLKLNAQQMMFYRLGQASVLRYLEQLAHSHPMQEANNG